MERPGLVIFDCDGVLVDSEALNERVLKNVLTRYGVLLDSDLYRSKFQGLTNEAVADLVTKRWGVELPGEFGTDLVSEESRWMVSELKAVPGVVDVISSIVAAGKEVCVASNGPTAAIEDRLRFTGLISWFGGRLFSADQVARGKPYPDVFLFAAVELGYVPEDCVVIEDSEPGIKAGVAAGMRVLAYDPAQQESIKTIGDIQSFREMSAVPGLLGISSI